jgi:hypothetical protein
MNYNYLRWGDEMIDNVKYDVQNHENYEFQLEFQQLPPKGKRRQRKLS